MSRLRCFRLFGLVLGLALLSGQLCGQSELRKANEHFRSYEFALAITEYQKVLQSRPPTLAIAQNLAHAYRLNNNSQEAEAWFARVLAFPDHDPINIYHYAEALKRNGKYAEARVQYQAYAAKVPAEAAVMQNRIAAVDLAQSWRADPAPYRVQPEAALNSTYADFSPVSFDNGMLFVSDRPGKGGDGGLAGWTGRPYLQLFYTQKGQQGWQEPTPLEPVINSALHNGPAVQANGTNILYFTRTFRRKERQKGANTDPTSWTGAGPQGEVVNRLTIYSIEKRGGKWAAARPFAYNKVESYSVGHPALSPDGRYLYFVSDMPGGQGQTDIYFCERRGGGSWSRPVNAGPVINTSGRESFPVVAPDGTLYFASDGHPGMGGLDLFSAKGEKASWREVVNLKPPFNSPKDDFGILFNPDKQTGYLSSNRDARDGTDDIYAFSPVEKIEPPVSAPRPLVLAVRTVARANNAQPSPLPGVSLKLVKAGSRDTLRAASDGNGYFYQAISRTDRYLVLGAKAGYLSRSANLAATAQSDTVRVELELNPAARNTTMVLRNIYYDLDKAEIRPDAALELDRLVQLLQDNPNLKIELSAHTDSRESQAYNLRLSQRRAQAVVDYLVSRGIAANRLLARGYGKSRLANRCRDGVPCSEEEHQQNRRTEFKIR